MLPPFGKNGTSILDGSLLLFFDPEMFPEILDEVRGMGDASMGSVYIY